MKKGVLPATSYPGAVMSINITLLREQNVRVVGLLKGLRVPQVYSANIAAICSSL